MAIEICEEFAERLAKREQELAEDAAQFPFASFKKGDAEASPVRPEGPVRATYRQGVFRYAHHDNSLISSTKSRFLHLPSLALRRRSE